MLHSLSACQVAASTLLCYGGPSQGKNDDWETHRKMQNSQAGLGVDGKIRSPKKDPPLTTYLLLWKGAYLIFMIGCFITPRSCGISATLVVPLGPCGKATLKNIPNAWRK